MLKVILGYIASSILVLYIFPERKKEEKKQTLGLNNLCHKHAIKVILLNTKVSKLCYTEQSYIHAHTQEIPAFAS